MLCGIQKLGLIAVLEVSVKVHGKLSILGCLAYIQHVFIL